MADLDQIIAEIRRSNIVAFIGAGLSMGAGLPNWVDLIRPLAAAIGATLPPPPYLTASHLLNIAEQYERKNGRNELQRYLRDELDKPGIVPTTAHLALASLLPTGVLVTTNYDSLLEQAYRSTGNSFQHIVIDNDLAYWEGSRAQIIKMRGDLGQVDTLTVTQRDYDTYPVKAPLIYNHLKGLLITKTLLFIGYSFSDPDLELLFNQIDYLLQGHSRTRYAITLDASGKDAAAWATKGVRAHLVDPASKGRTNALEDFFLDVRSRI